MTNLDMVRLDARIAHHRFLLREVTDSLAACLLNVSFSSSNANARCRATRSWLSGYHPVDSTRRLQNTEDQSMLYTIDTINPATTKQPNMISGGTGPTFLSLNSAPSCDWNSRPVVYRRSAD